MMRSFQISLGAALVASLAMVSAGPSSAAVLQIDTSSPTPYGNQAYSGVGVEFTVNSPIDVYALGIFEPTGSVIGAAALTADLMTLTGTVLASQTFTSAASGSPNGNGYSFTSIAPLKLADGTYYLMGYGWDSNNQEHNSNVDNSNPDIFNTAGGLVSFVQAVWGGQFDAPGTVPTNTYGPTAPNFFSAANIDFAAAPLPSTWTMLIAGFVGLLGFLALGGKKRNAATTAAA
jgi:hypothetical protein